MLVTINTDASVKEIYGGYAFWIVCDAGKIQKAGKIKQIVPVGGSTDAETMCIANAIYTLKHSRFTGISKIIINTDSKESIAFLTNKARCKSSSPLFNVVEECRFNMMELCLRLGKSIRDVDSLFEFRWVKAHNGKKDARSFVNDWCDKEAKKYCKLRVKEG